MAVPPGPSAESGVSAAAPTCFRHPDRETYVSCVRCGRPACPDCLRSAAVGQQCVDCVRGANQGARQATGQFGGRVPTGRPVVTSAFVALCVVVYIAELVSTKTVTEGEISGGPSARVLGEPVGVAVG